MRDRDLQGAQFGCVKVWTHDDDSFLFLDCCCSAVLKIAEPELQSFRNILFYFFWIAKVIWTFEICLFQHSTLLWSANLAVFSWPLLWAAERVVKVLWWDFGETMLLQSQSSWTFFNLSLFADVVCRRLWASNIVIRPFQVSWICFCISTKCYWLRKSHKNTFSFSDFRDNKRYLMESLIQADDKNVLCLVYSRGYLRGI